MANSHFSWPDVGQYPLKPGVSKDPVPLGKHGWYVYPEYTACDVYKTDGKGSPCRLWIENWDGIFTIHGDAPAYVQELYLKWLQENTVLTYISDVPDKRNVTLKVIVKEATYDKQEEI